MFNPFGPALALLWLMNLSLILYRLVDDLLHAFLDDVDILVAEGDGRIRIFRHRLNQIAVNDELSASEFGQNNHTLPLFFCLDGVLPQASGNRLDFRLSAAATTVAARVVLALEINEFFEDGIRHGDEP